jgi:hypothetical protein
MSKRLFTVVSPFSARYDSGGERVFRAEEELFAEHPVPPGTDTVVFEQDNMAFSVNAQTFLACAKLKSPVDKLLDQPSFGGAEAPRKCAEKGCGHQRLEHKNGRGACTAQNVVGGRQIPCSCQEFKRAAS